jgi:hypothetical protein
MKKGRNYALVSQAELLCAPLSLSLGFAQLDVHAVEDGHTLAQKVYNRDDGQDFYAQIRLVLIDAQGNERPRAMVAATKDYGDLSKHFIRFTSPASIADTAFLAWENDARPDDQFLYLPALGRVRRIVSSQKNHQFMNTDFTYEDMERRKADKDVHRILRSDMYEQYDCWVLESIPKDKKDSQYDRIVSWIVKDSFVPVKVEYYDKHDKLVKKFLVHRLEKVNNIWTVMESKMHDMVNNHLTVMQILNIQYNSGIEDQIFTRRYMQQAH